MSYTFWHLLGVAVAAGLLLRIVRRMGQRGRFIPMPFELLVLLYAVWAICAVLAPGATLNTVALPLLGAISIELLRTASLRWLKYED